MKKSMALLLALLLVISLAACGNKTEGAQAVGGWTLTEDAGITETAQGAFDKALEGLVGVNYTPVALLGTQLVSGTNYCFLCEATVVYPDAQPYYAVVTVYQDLEGKAEIRNIVALDLGRIAGRGILSEGGAEPMGEGRGDAPHALAELSLREGCATTT